MKKFENCPFCGQKMHFGGKGKWNHLDCDRCKFWTDVDDNNQIIRIPKCDVLEKQKKFESDQLDEFERLMKLRPFR